MAVPEPVAAPLICVISRAWMIDDTRRRWSPRGLILGALFGVYVLATAVHIGWVLAHEPFAFDAWNVAVDTGARPFSPGNFVDYWWQQYTQSNPRLGQPLTYLGYKLEYVAETLLPAAFLAISLAVTVLGTARWPWRSPRGLALWSIAIGFAWFALPELGRNLFCRAYGFNYVFGAAVQLWFLVPLRLVGSRAVSIGPAVAFGALGFVAGTCNEHTGPAVLAVLAVALWLLHRRGQPVRLVAAGTLGFALGFAAIFFAPGQGSRYGGLAQELSLLGRVLQRGVTGNLDILRDFLTYASPLLALIAVVLLASLLGRPLTEAREEQRVRALRLIALALGIGTIVAITLFVSPKLGARFHFVGLALLLAGFLSLVDAVVVRARGLAPLVALAVFASGYAVTKTVPLYRTISMQAAERMAALGASRPDSVFVADAWLQVDESWWFIGDDFRDFGKRELVARYFGLSRVVFRGYGRRAPLGMQGIRFAARYVTDAASCPAEYDEFEFGYSQGFDVATLHEGTKTSVGQLRRELAPAQLTRFELEIEFLGARPALPREQLILSRWVEGRFEGYAGKITRAGQTRIVTVPPELGSHELFILQLGGGFRPLGASGGMSAGGVRAAYVPWRRGVYWALACDPTTCWVFAAGRS